LLVLVALAVLGTWMHKIMARGLHEQNDRELKALLDAQKANAQAAAQTPGVSDLVVKLEETASHGADNLRAAKEERGKLSKALEPLLKDHRYSGYVILNRDWMMLAATADDRVGTQLVADKKIMEPFVKYVFADQAVVTRPFAVRQGHADLSDGVPTMFAAAPVKNQQGDTIAVLALTIPPKDVITILKKVCYGNLGATPAFDEEGVLLSGSGSNDWRTLRVLFWVLFGLLAGCAAGLFFFTALAGRLRRLVRRTEREVQQLGQYTLEGQIGSGGMGTVYRARHALLRRPTAVKLLVPDKASATAAARFEREVQQTCRLNHPNTVAIYDFGRTANGIFYYAMEYLDGVDLETLVQKHGPLPDGRVVPILTQLCGSLAEAHDIGLVHRDVKPANVMLMRRSGVADFVKLLDFGLVKAMQDEQPALTAAGAITGTPEFLSPEVIENPEKVSPRSDLYSLGAVAYFLLTGKPVFEGPNSMDVCRQQVTDTPVPPSQRAKGPIAADLEAVVLCCLAKKPEDRPASARELAARLARCRPTTPWSAEDAEAWWKTQPVRELTPELTYSTLDPFPGRTVTFSTLDPNEIREQQRKRRPG
jgi:serine/threonine protein kinase